MNRWKKYRNRVLIIGAVAAIGLGTYLICSVVIKEAEGSLQTAAKVQGNNFVVSQTTASQNNSSKSETYVSSSASSESKPSSSRSPSSGSSSLQPASSQPRETSPADYQSLYPDLYAKKEPGKTALGGKVVYLTFDDGPSNLTMPLLNVLDRYHVKATFFVVGKTGRQELEDMKEIVKRGHSIGMHSYTHDYKQIYASTQAFLSDFERIHSLIQKTTGVDTHIYRFPGGSYNGYNHRTANQIITEMNRRGYTYYDWNVDSGDAEAHPTASSIYNRVVSGVNRRGGRAVVLMHNTNVKRATLTDVPRIIETLQREGVQFGTLDETVDNAASVFPVSK